MNASPLRSHVLSRPQAPVLRLAMAAAVAAVGLTASVVWAAVGLSDQTRRPGRDGHHDHPRVGVRRDRPARYPRRLTRERRPRSGPRPRRRPRPEGVRPHGDRPRRVDRRGPPLHARRAVRRASRWLRCCRPGRRSLRRRCGRVTYVVATARPARRPDRPDRRRRRPRPGRRCAPSCCRCSPAAVWRWCWVSSSQCGPSSTPAGGAGPHHSPEGVRDDTQLNLSSSIQPSAIARRSAGVERERSPWRRWLAAAAVATAAVGVGLVMPRGPMTSDRPPSPASWSFARWACWRGSSPRGDGPSCWPRCSSPASSKLVRLPVTRADGRRDPPRRHLR